jgi:protein involved in polysaccharide export with SLBB domain
MNRFFSPISVALAAAIISAPLAASASATIHSGDHIHVRVYNHEDLSADVITNSDGSVGLPLAGNVQLTGLTESAAANRIETALHPFLRRPAVNVRITQQAQMLFLTGAYNGVAPFSPGESLGSAIGNLTQRPADNSNVNVFNTSSVDMRNVRILRNAVLLPQIFNLEQLSRSGQSGPTLEPGDTIELSTKPIKIDVRGTLRNPGPVYLYAGDTLAQAVSQAGGYGEITSVSRIVLNRNGTSAIVSSGSPVMAGSAQDGDVLVLQPAVHIDVLGVVQHPGVLVLQSGNSLYAALYQAGGPAAHADLAHVKVVHDGETTNHDLSKIVRGDVSANMQLLDDDTIVVPKGRGIDGATATGAASFLATLKYML